MNLLIMSLIISLISFILIYAVTPSLIKKFGEIGLIVPDVHKSDADLIPTFGGIIILSGYALAVILFILQPFQIITLDISFKISAALLTIILIGLLGGLDDLKPIRQRYKFLLPACFSFLIILACRNQSTSVAFPLIGSLEFGILYLICFIPLAITTASNFTNMLAGFNGIEAGSGFVACAAISIIGFILGKFEVVILTLPLAAALLAFLRYNWYPSKIFPGDSGTMMIGAVIASAAIIGKIEVPCMIVLIPHAMDFTLKLLNRRPFSQRQIYGNTAIHQNGILYPPPYPALLHMPLRLTQLTEKQLVKNVICLEVAFAVIAIIIAILIY